MIDLTSTMSGSYTLPALPDVRWVFHLLKKLITFGEYVLHLSVWELDSFFVKQINSGSVTFP